MEDDEKKIKITPKPILQIKKRVGRPRTNPVVRQEDKRPVGRPRTRPVGAGKALGEKRPLTKNRRHHLEKMRVALRASRARKKAEKDAEGTRMNNLVSDHSHLTNTVNVAEDNVANPGRQTTRFTNPAPKPDYNTPALKNTTNEGLLNRGLENDNWNSNVDIPHHSFMLGAHPSGVSYPGGSQGASVPPIVGTHDPSHSRGSGTGDIAHPGDNKSFFL